MGLGVIILAVFAVLPFFTLGEDTLMYKSVALDVILLLVLLMVLFTTSKAIHEEIEDRTMLTLMSKPLRRWEVLIGKYFGIILAALLAVAVLGGVLILCVWVRIPNDYMLRAGAVNLEEATQIWDYRQMHIIGLLPSLALAWQEICVLAAVGMALSTRFSLVVNLPAVILLYIAGNLTRFAELMNIHWECKVKRDPKISGDAINSWYQLARENGALGGKLIGAGGGGFLLFYAEDRLRLRRALRDAGLKEVRFRFDFDGTKVMSQQ